MTKALFLKSAYKCQLRKASHICALGLLGISVSPMTAQAQFSPYAKPVQMTDTAQPQNPYQRATSQYRRSPVKRPSTYSSPQTTINPYRSRLTDRTISRRYAPDAIGLLDIPTQPKPPVKEPVSDPQEPLALNSEIEAARFLSRMTFGGNSASIDDAMNKIPSKLLQAEFAKPATYYLPPLKTAFENGDDVDNRAHGDAFWDSMIESDDQLRQRMVFALSQIIVASDASMNIVPLTNAHYMDVLSEHAFGNFRDLLQDITYSPGMGRYLTYLRNRKGDPATGRQPDENYAREILQLFTIGLVELNMDGTPKLVNGVPVELYDNDDIVGLAKVFTGFTGKGTGFFQKDPDSKYADLVMFEGEHSQLEKKFLGLTIPANTNGVNSVNQALDHIFAHPNVAPFISRQLIQRFTASHPTPDYVERVARAFETGSYTWVDESSFGTGQRGDLEATLAAILLDERFFFNRPEAEAGKIREPALKFAHWARAFDVGNVDASNEKYLHFQAGKNTHLGQQPFQSPSVFNFYRPGYVAPNSVSGAAGLTAPELQSANEGAVIGYSDFMMRYVYNDTPVFNETFDSYVPDYSDEVLLAHVPEALADHLNVLLLDGKMSAKTREAMITIMNEIPIRTSPTDAAIDRLDRVEIAVYLAVTSPAFAVRS